MPNWCNISVEITGPKNKIADLWTEATVKEGLLEAMAPIGEWQYDTAVEAWSTKWDVSLEGLEFIDNEDGTASIVGYAVSAWAPPINAFSTYALKNEDVYVEVKYFEPGCDFTGVWDSEGGDAYWEGVGDLLETTQEDDAVLYDLLEHFDVWSWYDDADYEEEEILVDE